MEATAARQGEGATDTAMRRGSGQGTCKGRGGKSAGEIHTMYTKTGHRCSARTGMARAWAWAWRKRGRERGRDESAARRRRGRGEAVLVEGADAVRCVATWTLTNLLTKW